MSVADFTTNVLYLYNISYFVNKSLIDGHYPDEFKCAKVVPVYKKGCSKKVSSYRPISINSLLSKIFEKIVLDRLMRYVYENNLLSQSHFGFVSKSNTEAALL